MYSQGCVLHWSGQSFSSALCPKPYVEPRWTSAGWQETERMLSFIDRTYNGRVIAAIENETFYLKKKYQQLSTILTFKNTSIEYTEWPSLCLSWEFSLGFAWHSQYPSCLEKQCFKNILLSRICKQMVQVFSTFGEDNTERIFGKTDI